MTKAGGAPIPPAALVGSLATFSFIDLLHLLCDSRAVGELQVVSNSTDHHLWCDHGVIAAPDQAFDELLQLSCYRDGWFYFTDGTPAPAGARRQDLGQLIDDLQPKVEEWRRLLDALPLDALVFLSASTPNDEVRLSRDQWRVLSKVAACSTINEVLAAAGAPPLETLRHLATLLDAELLTVIDPHAAPNPSGRSASEPPPPRVPPRTAPDRTPPDRTPPDRTPPAPGGTRFLGAIMPPPISGDPWTKPPEPVASEAAST